MSSRSMMSRIILGVTFSAGAALGLLYLYYKKNQHHGPNAQRRQKQPEKISTMSIGSNNLKQNQSSTEKLPVNASTCEQNTINDKKASNDPASSEIIETATSSIVTSLEAKDPDNDVIPDESEFDRDRNSIVRDMKINRDVVAGLIGKKGSNIKEIQRKSNTEIKFKDSTLDNGDRVCVIRGAPADVVLAESLIEKFMTDQPIITTQCMSVPLSSVGRIIGQGGTTIRGIQDSSKARVNVEPKLDEQYKVAEGFRIITMKGTTEQIEMARLMILEKVEEEKSLRKRIDIATSSRTPRRGGNNQASSNSVSAEATAPNISPLRSVGMTEIFVSCVYHPNNFWIQVMGRDSIELDKLCDTMTSWYAKENNVAVDTSESHQFMVGDLVAAPFDDKRMYRGKITRIENDTVNVVYVDYGDMRDLNVKDLQSLQPEFLQLRFQAIEATLNLECGSEKWSDEIIDCFCDLTYCAQWKQLTGKVKDFLKDPVDNRDIIWIELLDKELNVGDELIRRGYAKPSPSPSATPTSEQTKTYAAVASGEQSSSSSTSNDK